MSAGDQNNGTQSDPPHLQSRENQPAPHAAKLAGPPDFELGNHSTHGSHGNGQASSDSSASGQMSGDVTLVAETSLPTRHGTFRLVGFFESDTGKEHTALVRGEVAGRTLVPVRIHSECHTGDIFGSLRCDCRDQLDAAMHYLAERDFGAIIYLRQEGRGIGLLNKIKAYRLQELGLDTVEANEYLGLPIDARDYAAAARMIELLEIESVLLLTNNPEKLDGLGEAGVNIEDRVPLITPPNEHNDRYLQTKRDRLNHMLE